MGKNSHCEESRRALSRETEQSRRIQLTRSPRPPLKRRRTCDDKYPLRVILIGLGPIGLETCQALLSHSSFDLVGVVDKDPKKIGRTLGELMGGGQSCPLRVAGDIKDCVGKAKPAIAFLTTTSKFRSIVPDVKMLVRLGVDVVSSCEELSYPWLTHKKLADEVDGFVRKNQGRVVGTGVNPGFLMDALPLFLTTVCQKVDAIRIRRIVDLAKRRRPLQEKMAVGLSSAEFRKRMEVVRMGHVGLPESLAMIARSMGWKVKTQETIGPVLADKPMRTQYFSIRPGHVIGVAQVLKGIADGQEKIVLELTMCVDAADPRDEVEIDGLPPIRMKISGGTHGDRATTACMLNAALKLSSAPCGIVTVRDLKAAL